LNFQEEDNLSTNDTKAEFIFSLMHPLLESFAMFTSGNCTSSSCRNLLVELQLAGRADWPFRVMPQVLLSHLLNTCHMTSILPSWNQCQDKSAYDYTQHISTKGWFSAWRCPWWCSQNLSGSFPRAVMSTRVELSTRVNGNTKSFITLPPRRFLAQYYGQCMKMITTV